MPDIDLDDLEKRLAGLPAGPWQWVREYGLSDGLHWCLSNDVFAAEGRTIDHLSITQTTAEVDHEYAPDDSTEGVPVPSTPVMSFLADSRALAEALLARVRLLDGIVADGRLDMATLIAIEREQAFNAGYQAGQEEMRERAAQSLWSNMITLRPIINLLLPITQSKK